MELQQQIDLVETLIKQRCDRTIRDFIRIRTEMEKYGPIMQKVIETNIKKNKKVIRYGNNYKNSQQKLSA